MSVVIKQDYNTRETEAEAEGGSGIILSYMGELIWKESVEGV